MKIIRKITEYFFFSLLIVIAETFEQKNFEERLFYFGGFLKEIFLNCQLYEFLQ